MEIACDINFYFRFMCLNDTLILTVRKTAKYKGNFRWTKELLQTASSIAGSMMSSLLLKLT